MAYVYNGVEYANEYLYNLAKSGAGAAAVNAAINQGYGNTTYVTPWLHIFDFNQQLAATISTGAASNPPLSAAETSSSGGFSIYLPLIIGGAALLLLIRK